MTALDEKVIVFYYGLFLQENIEGMGKALRLRMQQMDMDFSVLQAVFSVYVEMCQNIVRYSSEKQIGSMEVRRENGDIVIESKNHIADMQKEPLEERLGNLNRLNKVQLRQAYVEQRRKEERTGSQSVGLGLIEIAKRALGPLEYEFEKEGDDQVFRLNVRIGGKLKCIV